jgi:hypothetical protein
MLAQKADQKRLERLAQSAIRKVRA